MNEVSVGDEIPAELFQILKDDVKVLHSVISVTESWLTLCDPMDHSMPAFPAHYQLSKLTQTHVHRVHDVIQTYHPLSSPSPPTFNLSQFQGLFL